MRKLILVLFALCALGCIPVPAQSRGDSKPVKYRVRAVHDSVYLPDTLFADHTLRLWSPYAKDFMLTLINPNGYVVEVLQPHRNGWKRGSEMQGWYSYDLVWFDFRGKRSVKSGKVFVL